MLVISAKGAYQIAFMMIASLIMMQAGLIMKNALRIGSTCPLHQDNHLPGELSVAGAIASGLTAGAGFAGFFSSVVGV